MYPRTSLILVVLATLLAALVWFESRMTLSQAEPIAPIQSTASEAAAEVSSSVLQSNTPPPLATLTETVERPLFSSTRRVMEAPVVAPMAAVAAVATPVNPPKLSLTAVVINGEDRVAVVSLSTGTAFERLREGDQVEGWTVERINPQGLRLSRGGTVHEVELRSFESAPVPARSNPARAAAAKQRPRRAPRGPRQRSQLRQRKQ